MRGPQAGRCQGSPVLAKDEPVCTPCPLAENHGDATATGSILLQIGTASLGLRGKEMKRSTLGSGGQSQGHTTPKLDLETHGGGIVVDPFGRVGFSSCNFILKLIQLWELK